MMHTLGRFCRYPDLLISVALALVLAGSTIFSTSPVWIDMVLGVAFLGYVPGYVLMAIMFPRRKDLPSEQRVALAIVLSFTLAPMVGYLLYGTRFGLRLSAWKLTIAGLTLVASGAAALRRRLLGLEPGGLTDALRRPGVWAKERVNDPNGRALSCAMGLAALILAGSVSYAAVTYEGGNRYTEFYIRNGDAPGAQLRVSSEDVTGASMDLWVVNHERRPMVYKIVQLYGQNSTGQAVQFALNHGERHRITAHLLDTDLKDDQVTFLLFVNDDPVPYRSLIWSFAPEVRKGSGTNSSQSARMSID